MSRRAFCQWINRFFADGHRGMNSKRRVGCVGADDCTSVGATLTVPACTGHSVVWYCVVSSVHCSQDCGNIKLCPAKADITQRARM